MNIKLKQMWGLVILIVVTLSYLAINVLEVHKSGTEIKKIYFADRMTAAHKILIEEYNELHKGKIEVVPIDFPNEDFSTNERKEVLARSLRGRGDGIDIFAVDIIWVQRFAKWGEPLDNYFTQEEKSKIMDEALESCYYDGELVAAPLDMGQGIMYYRQDLLKKLKNGEDIIKKIQDNITWEDFIKLKNQINLPNPFFTFPAADYEGLVCIYIEELLSLKPKYFEENGFNFETPEAEKTLQLLVDMVNKDNLTPPAVTQYTETSSFKYFINNNGLFLWGWTSYDKDFKDSPVDVAKQVNLRKAPLPYFKNGRPASILGGWDIMISKFSDKKKEAADFIKFLLSNKSQETFFQQSAYYPVIKKFYDDPQYVKKYPEIALYKKLLKTGVHRPAHVEYTKYSKIMSYYFNLAIRKKISVRQALNKCTKAIQLDKLILK